MIGVVGITIYPKSITPSLSWERVIKKNIQNNFPVEFLNVTHEQFIIELCVNSKFSAQQYYDSIFIGQVNQNHKFSSDDHGLEFVITDDIITVKNDWLASIPFFIIKIKVWSQHFIMLLLIPLKLIRLDVMLFFVMDIVFMVLLHSRMLIFCNQILYLK